MNEIELRLFGAFRKFEGGSPTLRLSVPTGATALELKRELQSHLERTFPDLDRNDGARLIADSAIASEDRVLDDGELIPGQARLAILPPVCGG